MKKIQTRISMLHKILELWPFGIILVSVLFIAVPLQKPGIILGEDFPFAQNAMSPSKVFFTWVDFGSHNSFEILARYPVIFIGYILQLVGIGYDVTSKLMVIFGFFLASTSFYIFSTSLLKSRAEDQTKVKLAAIIGCIFYAYNIWSFDRIYHWYLWLGYAVLPLFFISLVLAFQNPGRWRYVFAAVLSFSLASSTPHMFIFFGLIFIGIALFFIIKSILTKSKPYIFGGISIIILSLFTLLNFYWIYPFLLSVDSGNLDDSSSLFGYVVTDEWTKRLSNDGLNVIRLVSDWEQVDNVGAEADNVPTSTSQYYHLWYFISFLLPALAFSALLSKTFFRYAIIFSGLAIVGILLVMGSNAPFDFYSKLLFDVPVISEYNAFLRDPNKWGVLIAFGYSVLLSISSFEILKFVRKKARLKNVLSGLFIFSILGSIAVYSYPIYSSSIRNELQPAILPNDFGKLNTFMNEIDTDKVVYFPFFKEEVPWNNHRVANLDLYHLSSAKPNIGSYSILGQNYYRYVSNLILQNNTNNIGNLISPFGTSYLIFHNDTNNLDNLELLNGLSSSGDLERVNSLGLFSIFKTDANVSSISIPNLNFAAVGGLDTLTSLNHLDSFNSNDTSLLFLDQDADNEIDAAATNITNAIDGLILTENANDLILSSIEDNYVIAPYDATNHHNVSGLWSKAGVLDPWHGEFHPYLQELGIENWDFDYGKGVVITDAKGAKLDIPFEIKNSNSSYNDIFLRYMENQNGGEIRVFLDNKLIRDINTEDEKSNSFVWENIVSNINLTQGEHTLTIENVDGFNAVNIFAAFPVDETIRLTENAHSLADITRNIYLLEAKSDFYSSGSEVSRQLLFHDIKNESGPNNNSSSRNIEGNFQVPRGADTLSIYFLARQNQQVPSSFTIKNLEIVPSALKQEVFRSDFDENNKSADESRRDSNILLEGTRADESGNWLNEDPHVLSPRLVSDRSGPNQSLRVDVKQGNTTDWNVMSTDYIPTKGNINNFNYSMDIAANNVNQLHSKIVYYDLEKKEIQEDNLFGGRDGTFKQQFTGNTVAPYGTTFVKLQVWSNPNSKITSHYLLDNVSLEQIFSAAPASDYTNFKNMNTSNQHMTVTEDHTLRVDLKKGKSNYFNIIYTEPVQVNELRTYNYTIDLELNNLTSFDIYASAASSDVKYRQPVAGIGASFDYNDFIKAFGGVPDKNNNILTLQPNSEVYTELDILKPSNYTLGIHTNTCNTCNLRVSIEDDNGNNIIKSTEILSNNSNSNSNSSELKWLYLHDVYLNKGHYKIRIDSDSQTDLDSVVLYSSNGNHNATLDNIFNSSDTPAAHIVEYSKIDPTKYIVKISNATRPFVLSFAESFDPLWTASITDKNNSSNSDNFKSRSLPLYSIINGFYIDKLGNYTITIEYAPQQWFVEGGMISIATLIICIAAYFIFHKYRVDRHLYNLREKILSH